MSHTRFHWIDAWRGLAIIGMIVFHFFLIIDFYEVISYELYEGAWLVFARAIQLSFLGLVGVSMVLTWLRMGGEDANRAQYARIQRRRAALIGAAALAITIVTRIAEPGWYVRFGILHLISISIVALIPLVRRPLLAATFAFVALSLGTAFAYISTGSGFIHLFGFHPGYYFASMDFFPIFPWIGVPAAGIFLGHALSSEGWLTRIEIASARIPGRRLLARMGRRALPIYVLHVPILLIVLFLTGVIDLT